MHTYRRTVHKILYRISRKITTNDRQKLNVPSGHKQKKKKKVKEKKKEEEKKQAVKPKAAVK